MFRILSSDDGGGEFYEEKQKIKKFLFVMREKFHCGAIKLFQISA